MKKKKVNLKIFEIKKKPSHNELTQIINLIKYENNYSILSKLNKPIITEYLNIAIKSNNIFLFILKIKNKIIGYSLYAKNEKNLIKDFNPIKFKIFIHLLCTLKFFSIMNIFLAITKLDLILLNKKDYNKKKVLNLNLLAINKNFQSQGIGEYFLTKTIRIIYRNVYRFNYVTCEAPSLRSLNFYVKKKKFKLIGKKIRLTTNLYVLVKKLNEI